MICRIHRTAPYLAFAILALQLWPLPSRAAGDANAPPPTAATAVDDCLYADTATEDPGKLAAIARTCTDALATPLSTEKRVAALLNRGIAYRDTGRLDAALADLTEARKLAPTNTDVGRMLGWTYRTMGREAEAEAEYDRVLQLEPDRVAFLSRCVVRLDARQYDKALPDCETAHRMGVSEDTTYFTASAYYELGRHDDAIRVIEAELNGAHASGRLYGKLYRAYMAKGREADADRAVKAGLAKFPKDTNLSQPPPAK